MFEPTPEPKQPGTKHCHQCGWTYDLPAQPGRTESCPQCKADLKVCLNCISYEARVAQQCRDRRADPVQEKASANFCEYFEIKRRPYAKGQTNSREDQARNNLKNLLGD